MKKALAWILPLAVLAALALVFLPRGGEDAGSYRFVEIERGDLESLVSSTGTLEAVTTVEVGTQVSGIISDILVDFNERVEKGQVIARLDSSLLALSVKDAAAGLEQAEARLRYTRDNYDRLKALFEDEVITETEMIGARYDYESALASREGSRVKLELAQRNLAYATITAPIDGTVIERDVDVGQTVAASFSAPQLFLIAEDLSRMQIEVTVDESDIGQIREGLAARFTVQAWPDDSFEGTVEQVRLQSSQSENIVTYTVIVSVDNSDLKLLPGMTASVDFVTDSAEDVLLLPNAALRFRPGEEMMQQLREKRQAARGEGDEQQRQGPRMEGQGRPANMAMLFFLDEDGELDACPVRTGLSDGSSTVVTGRLLEEGMRIIAGTAKSGGETSSSNPFQNNGNSGARRGPPGPGF